ncbi:MAG: CRISPR-associated endonuclease Cas1 [Verrucomicrobia bacterium]|nr:CRISPR-associated endonuclease Cas1 [Verrucomicrobiota bacterium]
MGRPRADPGPGPAPQPRGRRHAPAPIPASHRPRGDRSVLPGHRLRQDLQPTSRAPAAARFPSRVGGRDRFGWRTPTAAAGPATGSSPSPDLVEQAFVRLAALDQDLARAQDTAQIVGFEGASTAAYFQAWASFLPPEFPFERRSARPPLNPVNACISYGASLLYHEMVARLHLTGLDPGLGALHATEDGRWSLALDLMEPFRPALVEAMTLRLFAHRMLQAGDFEPSHGGIYLAASGRRTFLAEYEQRVNREFLSEHVGHRTTLRQQLAGQPVAYKAALTDPPSFRPFRLN